ncbi:MAG: M56 family metallopeptidase [Gemmatimonadaceae bacterium]|nr:M56 family metallopeptidase [Gemmatimonadaceae bacterium]
MTTRSRGQISGRLRLRENLHRRMLLLSAATLLLLATLPTIAHHLPIALGELPGVQHLWRFCLAALNDVLTPVHRAFHIALAIGLAYAFRDRIKATRSLRSVLANLDAQCPQEGDAIWNAAIAAGVDPSIVRIVAGLPNPAFTAGALAPRIYVASNLGARLSADELALVFAHEAAHVRRRDPLRLSIYRFLSCMFFWIPALRALSDDIADEAEIEADDSAGARAPLILASAILRLADCGGSSRILSTVGFQNPDLLERRVRRLAGEETSLPTRLTRLSIIGACLSVALVFSSGLAAAAGPGGPAHCRHTHTLPFAHLFATEQTGSTWKADARTQDEPRPPAESNIHGWDKGQHFVMSGRASSS